MEDTATDLAGLTLDELLTRLASHDPIPGGGSASAIAGAMGAALVGMVVELTVRRPEAADHAADLERIAGIAAECRAELLHLASRDAAAYDAVVRARRLPKASDEERRERRAALAAAMEEAAAAPLQVARVALRTLEQANRIAPIGNVNAVSDAGVAAALAAVAVRGAALNVRINLPYLAEASLLRASAPDELVHLEEAAAELDRQAASEVARRLSPS